MLVIGLLYPVRLLERWLHQHLFKVGWLLTKNLRRTTIVYYCLFLPGVVLHEFTVWFVAGVLNVRAEAALAWPETQEMGELKLNFVKLAKQVGQVKLAMIAISPLLVGIGVLTLLANNVLNVQEFVALFQGAGSDGEPELGAALEIALSHLFAIPDLWLWLYLIFTIANTMMPEGKNLRGWRPILLGIGIAVAAMYALGVGDVVMTALLGGTLSQVLSGLALTFGVIIGVDLVMIALLGGSESLIERITGDSATFQNGKLVAVRRADLLKQKQQQREKEEKKQQAARRTDAATFYDLALPIPGGPGKVSAAQGVSPAEPAETERA